MAAGCCTSKVPQVGIRERRKVGLVSRLRVRRAIKKVLLSMAENSPTAENQKPLPDPGYPLDAGIKDAVYTLCRNGVETYESCQGGAGHAFPEPTVRFFGGRAEGLRALSVALHNGLAVLELRRVWPIIDGEPTGPCWEMVFLPNDDL